MRRLITLISTKNKTSKQVSEELTSNLEKYKKIYKEEYDKEISDQDALTDFTALVGYMGAVEKHQNNEHIRKTSE